MPLDFDFLIGPDELTLRAKRQAPQPALAFAQAGLPFASWQQAASTKLRDLLGFQSPNPCPVELLRTTQVADVRIAALRMTIHQSLSIPAYLLQPATRTPKKHAVIAIHGHGEVEAALGLIEDYHHAFALKLAQAGHIVLCPELRGFGSLFNLAQDLDGHRLEYWHWGTQMAYSLVTDAFQAGRTLIGETIEDLLRWETWLASEHGIDSVDSVGISYGGDLAFMYPVFSQRVRKIFASGTLGSFTPIFAIGYNAPAHCIPGILPWLDRADIAGINAPRPIMLHYGERDVPGPDNLSAAYNASVAASIATLKQIYTTINAEDAVHLVVSPGLAHEMDIPLLINFLA